MGTILLILFLVFILFPILKFGWRVHRVQNDINDAIRQQQEQFRKAYEEASGQAQRQKSTEPKDPGEYVDFEEVTDASATEPKRTAKTVDTTEEVADAEFEEVTE